MSSALEHAARLKPEVRLAQAVSQFEADLSNEQKTTFRTLKSKSLNSAPGPSDVMRLTAEIDRQVSRQVGSRCLGPRFTNFLQGVQQFAALGDVVVGGSQNIIACGVWSLVRMSLLAIINFSSYVEKVSTLFMDIGRSTPRYQTIALLYSRSKSLQSHLSEYFVVVVRLCHQLLRFSQKSAFRQLASTLSDVEIKAFRSELDLWANSIREEISLLVAKKIEEEAQENSRFRALASKRSRSVSYQQKLATNLRVLDVCSKYDHEITWKQTRKVGNAALFRQIAEYQTWKNSSSSCTLLCTGKLGSGKSVLLANIVDDLNIHVGYDNAPITYFFCRHDTPESLKSRTVLGSLARQLLRPIPDLAMVAEICDETSLAADTKKVLDLLHHALAPGHKAYFVLDGLDECDQSERELLARGIQELQKTLNLLVCISFRVQPNSGLDLITERFVDTRIASIPDDNPDIEAFIEAELERCLESRKLVIGDPTLILDIQDALLKGSQGMFLWVAFQIQSLCGMTTDETIRNALADLPKDLSETFARILRKSGELGQSYQTQILQLVFAAYRPLTANELREALSVIPGETIWNSSKILNNVYSALACCGCLLVVDEEEFTVRFVHHSVKQFVLNEFNETNNMSFTAEKAQTRLADTVITYLSYGVFGTEVSRIRVSPIMVESTPSSVIRTAIGSSSTVQSFALKLLRSRKQPNFDISKTLAEARKPFQSAPVEHFHFYSYAKTYWLHHVFYVSGQEKTISNLSVKLIKERVGGANVTIDSCWMRLIWAVENGNEKIFKLLIVSGKVNANLKNQSGQTPLSWAAENGREAIVKLLLDTGKVDVDLKDKSGRTPLWWAAERGHEAVVKLMLDTGKVDVDSKDKSGRTPLWWAAERGHEAVVKLLLDTGKVDVNLMDQSGQTPLWWAAEKGHEAVVKQLLDTGKVDVDLKNERGRTPLSQAAEKGYEAVVKQLLDTDKVDVDSKDNEDGQTPLSWAAANGHEAVLKLLLDTGKVDIDLKDNEYGQSPLSWAAERGHEAVVKQLLDTGKVDVDSKDKSGRTPLWWAAERGHEAVVKLLLDTDKVDVDSKDNEYGRTPLSWAAEWGHKAVVKLLLDTGKVDVDSKNERGQTLLSQAAEEGRKAVVKLLLDIGKVDVDSKDKGGRAPLSWAAASGSEAIVKLLLDTGKVDVDSKDNEDGQTPLSWAAANGHEAVVKLLLDTGKVDVESKDQSGQTPLWWAAEKGHIRVVKLLQTHQHSPADKF